MSQIPKYIEELWHRYRTPEHVKRHCRVVAEYARQLGQQLNAQGISVDIERLEEAGLVHDLVRVVDFRSFQPESWGYQIAEEDISVMRELRRRFEGMSHARAGGVILREEGYPELADLVEKHSFVQIDEGFSSWEEKLLYYADKRVKHDQLVSLKERLSDGKERNGRTVEETAVSQEREKRVFALEEEISKAAGGSI
ncbi:hypothetical protein CO046_00565 [Candidatus Peregrinibacteria bacterium CG_4_9_14_0_2_um_filter_53_11]|nr:MAG: hypothetical protein CO046_00565 [Candidatus Peregrinibacteria bacterium CG_4_9_14_0_2_um_filter_53_11]